MDDDQVREMLEARASATQHRLADVARAVATSHPRRAVRRGLRPAFSLAAGTAVFAALALILVVLPGRSQRPDTPTSSPPSDVATSMPVASAAATLAPERWEALTWYSGDDGRFEQQGRNVFIQAVQYWRSAWIAVGYSADLTSGRVAGLILHSEDGLTWRREPEQPDVEFDRLLTTASEAFLVGFDRQPDIGDQPGPWQPAIWASSDGRGWAEVQLPAGIDRRWVLLDVAIGGRGWLMRAIKIGVDEERWLIGDPRSGWTDLDLEDEAFPNAQVGHIVGTDRGWMAVGMTGADVGSDSGLPSGVPANDRGAIWSSNDASTWTPAQIDDPGTSVGAVYPLANGWIASGFDHGGCPRRLGGRSLLWRSDVGRAWTPLEIATSLDKPLGWGGVASDGRRAVLFDLDESGRLRIRETEDGIDWPEIAVYIDASATAISRGSGGVVGVGSNGVVTFVDPNTSPLGHSWMVPHVAIAGEPPTSAATQSPAPPPENHDVLCTEPAGEPCGP